MAGLGPRAGRPFLAGDLRFGPRGNCLRDPRTAFERTGEAALSPRAAMNRKPYWEMTPKELAEATKQFEVPFVADQSRPLTPAEREQWRRVKRKRGRPKVGQGFKRVSVSLEQGLLKQATVLAKKRHLS